MNARPHGSPRAGVYDLRPGRVLTIPFPELPRPLSSVFKGVAVVPSLAIRLPDNYRPRKKFPLFIHLSGGSGADRGDLSHALETAGPRDWIVGSLPLFKQCLDREEIYKGLLIGAEDFPLLSRAYGTMLSRLFRVVPNIDFTRSTIGGSSNGAHALAVLITGQDPVILKAFRNYYFGEGGFLQLADLHKRALRRHRFLMLVGARGRREDRVRNLLDAYLIQSRMIRALARLNGLEFRLIVRPDMGHDFDARCRAAVRRWARRPA